MQAQNAVLVKHYKDLAFMGFAEVIKNLPAILNNIKFCKQDIISFHPDVLVLIDYPGFNLRIAKWAKQNGFKVVYYIAPQVWAWKENRIKLMKKCIDKLICILPFEKDYFKNKWNWDVEYVGNPLAEEILEYRTQNSTLKTIFPLLGGLRVASEEKIIALLPGSRKQEIAKKLPVMLEASKQFPEYTFVVAKAPGQDDSFYEPFLLPYKNVQSVRNETYKLLLKSTAALVTSGTATLETALFDVPEVVCYKGSNISYQIAKRLIKVKYISLVNLIMDKLVVAELIQNNMNVNNAVKELNELLNNPQRRQQLQNDYAELKNILSVNGNASANAAKIVVNIIK
jgi:lipid-A-disaccharide synthase